MEFKNFFFSKKISKICLFFVLIIFIFIITNPFSLYSSFPKNLLYLAIILLITSIVSFFLNKNFDTYLTIIVISFLLSIYLGEAYLAFQNYNYTQTLKKDLNKNESSNQKFDNRSKFKIYNDMKKENQDITMSVPPLSYLFSGNISEDLSLFPFSGISNSQTIHCNESGYYSIYKSDRYGFNNPDSEWNKKKINLVLLGDSFVHGACVNRPYDVSSNLRNNYNLNVINLGYSSNGPLIEYATLKEYYLKSFENIVWVFFEGNDLLDLKFEKENSLLNNYITDKNFSQSLKNKQSEIDNLNKEVILNEKKFYFKKLIKLGNIRDLIVNFNKEQKDSNISKISNIKNDDILEFIDIILKAKEFSERNNLDFYFVYLPDTNRILDSNYDNKIYKFIKTELESSDIKFLDLKDNIYEKNNEILEYFPFGEINHFNENGYDRMAKEIYKFIYEK